MFPPAIVCDITLVPLTVALAMFPPAIVALATLVPVIVWMARFPPISVAVAIAPFIPPVSGPRTIDPPSVVEPQLGAGVFLAR
jgi:hypothetical protein